jgi:hypothetical protein
MGLDFSRAGHLPNLRAAGEPADPRRLPRQRRGVTPQMHGRYPDYDVLEQASHWDEATRKVVLDRVANVPPIRFFSGTEVPTLKAFCDTALAQDTEPRIPVLSYVDEKLHAGQGDGYRHADMPEDEETWRRVARHLHAAGFPELDIDAKLEYVGKLHDGELAWDDMDSSKAWGVVMRHALSAFYSHPWAWNEIGFGGPAYPRGYIRMGIGDHRGREPHEGEEAVGPDPVLDT